MKKYGHKQRTKNDSCSNLSVKCVPRSIKFQIRSTLQMFMPKNTLQFGTRREVPKASFGSTFTPKAQTPKRLQKENSYLTVGNSRKVSPATTPFTMEPEPIHRLRSDFRFLNQIGSGGFGRVWKAEEKKTGRLFAMKEMSKAKIIMKKSVTSVINERAILEEISNPFIINMRSAFQDREFLYLSMDYLRGGDLRYHLCFFDGFDEDITKFIVANIVLSLEYIHSKNVIHRDIKPENLVFQENGYLRLTDFGVARKKRPDNKDQTSGTPGYMAPEVICRNNHSFEADFFALGVIVYEIIMGVRPYVGQTRKEIRDKIISSQARLKPDDIPSDWSISCIDFVNGLLRRAAQSRLGYKGIVELKSHPWLNTIDWKRLANKELKPKFVPGIISESKQYQQEMENTQCSEASEEVLMLLRTSECQDMFKDYKNTEIEPFKIKHSRSPPKNLFHRY